MKIWVYPSRGCPVVLRRLAGKCTKIYDACRTIVPLIKPFVLRRFSAVVGRFLFHQTIPKFYKQVPETPEIVGYTSRGCPLFCKFSIFYSALASSFGRDNSELDISRKDGGDAYSINETLWNLSTCMSINTSYS